MEFSEGERKPTNWGMEVLAGHLVFDNGEIKYDGQAEFNSVKLKIIRDFLQQFFDKGGFNLKQRAMIVNVIEGIDNYLAKKE
jgi:hypothetical protein